ncbi:subclass B3 metallo-beta-lactamase [Aquisalinus flavus]|uniref:CAU/MBL1b family subclass B3 metallo-beta-lactamase n=1 Tax=Aquisalinus flavus TaxID=1526572 RepID=A0A8J2V4A0_9PROT|nr:subclass B3 metallo-beta-lactamase [Aquisalinus flavus]MBD0427925.1 subclass B3 metallo-beta-lactamase [Aquisalinus flavus]UNE47682.1 subclass B3 metallo-beta-lactamase [Aquisalinus flavus]GGD04986.1 CAU/MBL1b family subclass B3 metallo-beta-lactamase [Aquisalinus flavus]
MTVLLWAGLIAAITGGDAVQAVPAPQTAEAASHQWEEVCADWDDWDKPGPPFRVFGNTYYVGTCGIGAILITGSDGHVLIDGGTETGAEIIAANVQALGFDIADIRILLYSHEHFDHVAGLAALQRLSDARLLASPAAAPVLDTGEDAPSDPQYGMHEPFPAARVDGVVEDGDVLTLGDIVITAVATPGHTAGAMSWQWQSCDDSQCETIVYADSMSPVSADEYRFSDHPAFLAAYRASIEKLSGLDCTLLLTPHPSASALRERLEAGTLTDPAACSDYAEAVDRRLRQRLADETGAP